jgi:hypothetical protein
LENEFIDVNIILITLKKHPIADGQINPHNIDYITYIEEIFKIGFVTM